MLRRLLVAIPAAFLFALFAASVVSAHEGHDHSLLTADAGQELRGRVVETHGDTMTGEAKGRTFWLETGAERIRLVGAPDSLRPGERVRVRGSRKGESFLVAGDAGAVTADGPASVASVGPAVTKTVAVIAFTFSDNTSQPWTTDQIRANFFATSNSVRSYFSDASYGQVTVTGDVFGWYHIAANDDACNSSTWGTQAKAAATAAGVNLGAYQHIVFIFPRSAACGWAGLAYMPGTESWNNGTLSVRVAGHELAHNFGVHHASTLACTSGGVPVTLSTSCTESEYGDPFDIMGSAARLTNNWHRWRLGYFSNSEVVTVTSANAGQRTLGVVSLANSVPKIIRVDRGDGNFYYLEFRQPFGSFDNFAVGDSVVNGVLVRVAPDRTNVRPLLLDGHPATTTFVDAAFGPGQTFTDSARGISIGVVSVSTSGAVVNVSFGGGPSPSPTPTPGPSPTPTPGPSPTPSPTPAKPDTHAGPLADARPLADTSAADRHEPAHRAGRPDGHGQKRDHHRTRMVGRERRHRRDRLSHRPQRDPRRDDREPELGEHLAQTRDDLHLHGGCRRCGRKRRAGRGGRRDHPGRQDSTRQAAAIADRGRRFTPDKAHVGQRKR